MISVGDIPEMIEDLKTGNLSITEVYSLCLDLFERNEVGEVLQSLPPDLRDHVASVLRATYDNDTPSDEFLLLDSARGDHPAKHIIIEKIRSWIARQSRS